MSRTRKNKLYNFIVNTYGISQEKVLEIINKRVDDVIFKCIGMKLNSNRIEKVIADQIAKVINKGLEDRSMHRDSFNDVIRAEIARQIKERMNKDYQLEVKITNKSSHEIYKADNKLISSDLKEE